MDSCDRMLIAIIIIWTILSIIGAFKMGYDYNAAFNKIKPEIEYNCLKLIVNETCEGNK